MKKTPDPFRGNCSMTGFTKLETELERHQLRREAGVPTISVLVGAPSTAISMWRRWSLDRGWPVVIAGHTDQGRIVQDWFVKATENRGLWRAALAWLANASGRSSSEWNESLLARTAHERDVLLKPIVEFNADRDGVRLCQWVLTLSRDEVPDAERLADAPSQLFADRDHPAISAMAVMSRMMAPGTAPTLLVVPPENVTDAAESLIPIAQEASSLPIALAVPAADFHEYLDSAPESRSVAMLRETVLLLAGLEASAIQRHIEQSVGGAASRVEESIGRLVRDGCSDTLAGAFTDAASAVGVNEVQAEKLSAHADDEARSAAERFLFERLQSLPETRGLFELNGKLPADFGPTGEAEVDLLCRQLRMAIEIDGYYHFQDADCYRRDRRKDVALQKLDYFVTRVLAEDVVMRLGETLDLILDAVSFRRAQLNLS